MRPARRTVLWLWPLVLTAALAACAGLKSGGSSNQSTGTGGSGGNSCRTSVCPEPVLDPLLLAVEIAPPVGSGAGLTELLSKDFNQSNGPVSLAADELVAVTATFNPSSNAAVPASANILLDIPSVIPGRPDLTFQASASPSGSAGTSASTTLAISQGPLDRMAQGTLSLIPLPPSDQQSPPYSSPVALDPNASALVAGLPSDNFSISGKLLDALGNALKPGFVVRTFQGGTQVSSAPITGTDGSYLLYLPSAVATTGTPLTIQLTPQTSTDAFFAFEPIPLASPLPTMINLGTVSLQPYQKPPNQFNVSVAASAATPSPVSGAVVQMQTDLGISSSNLGQPPFTGATQFARSATTNSAGTASLSLLPGNANAALPYSVVVVPPPGSASATTCTTLEVPAGMGGVTTTSAPALGPVTVGARTVVSGQVTDSDGHPVSNVAITATPGPEAVSSCTSTTAAPASTTTDSQGHYSLPLDPGTQDQPVHYQLDFDPPSGSSAPRYTVTGFAVDDTTSTIPNDLRLPVGGLVAGKVTDSSTPPVPLQSATVRLFRAQCSSTVGCLAAPSLRGQAVTDANGNFQIVVPLIP
jgi:hypothetical protein